MYVQKDVPWTKDWEYQEAAWAKTRPDGQIKPIWINRPKVRGSFVKVDLHYCGICHSDVHEANNEFGGCMYPIVPGHELAGVVAEIGPLVTKVKVGDRVGIGCIIDSCLECKMCNLGQENYC